MGAIDYKIDRPDRIVCGALSEGGGTTDVFGEGVVGANLFGNYRAADRIFS
jgi:hypothetical protein